MGVISKDSLQSVYARNKEEIYTILVESSREAANILGHEKMSSLFSVKDSPLTIVSQEAA